MNTTADLEKKFTCFLDRGWDLDSIGPFLRSYLRLLVPYHSELSTAELSVLREREKQMQGFAFDDSKYELVRLTSKNNMSNDLKEGHNLSKTSALNRLIYCAMSDSSESDVFYLSEPIFEFANSMEIKSDQLETILCAEFSDFKPNS